VIVRSGEITDGQTVLLGRLTEKIDARDSARAGHILDDDRRITGNMLGQMARDDSPFDIGGATGGEIDQEGNDFAAIKRAVRCVCRRSEQNKTKKKHH